MKLFFHQVKNSLRPIKDSIFDIAYLLTGATYFLNKNISSRYYKKIKNSFFTSSFAVARLDGAQLSFSQEGEDLILKRFLENKIEQGFYIDVGAHHPSRFSNTYSFYLRGWSGINIEPNSDAIDLFNKIRPRDINLNLGIGTSNSTLEYFMFDEPAINTFSSIQSDKICKAGKYQLQQKIKVSVTSLSSILDEYWSDNKPITFMNVDCEGYDYQVMASNNWDKYRPLFVLVECINHAMGNKALDPKIDVCTFMESVEYLKIANTRNTVFWIDKSRKDFFS